MAGLKTLYTDWLFKKAGCYQQMEEQKTSGSLIQADVDQDQAGYFDLFRKSHLSLASHTGMPLETYRMVFIGFSEDGKEVRYSK